MDKIERRRNLTTSRDPDPRLDYVVTLAGSIPPAGDRGALIVEVRYVPDKLILSSGGFALYLAGLADADWNALEEIAVAVLDDVNNETVARWVQVTVSDDADAGDSKTSHSVMVEDRQPRWDNPALLGRLRRH